MRISSRQEHILIAQDQLHAELTPIIGNENATKLLNGYPIEVDINPEDKPALDALMPHVIKHVRSKHKDAA